MHLGYAAAAHPQFAFETPAPDLTWGADIEYGHAPAPSAHMGYSAAVLADSFGATNQWGQTSEYLARRADDLFAQGIISAEQRDAMKQGGGLFESAASDAERTFGPAPEPATPTVAPLPDYSDLPVAARPVSWGTTGKVAGGAAVVGVLLGALVARFG